MLSSLRFAVTRSLSGRAATTGSIASRQLLQQFSTKPEDDGTHDDFKPKIKAEPASGVEDTIKGDITQHRVFIYMKGNPEAPLCGFSNMACRILDAYGVPYGSRNVLEDPDIREGVKKFSEWPTIPQVFVNGEFIGGSDILMGMHQSGDLKGVLEGGGEAAEGQN